MDARLRSHLHARCVDNPKVFKLILVSHNSALVGFVQGAHVAIGYLPHEGADAEETKKWVEKAGVLFHSDASFTQLYRARISRAMTSLDRGVCRSCRSQMFAGSRRLIRRSRVSCVDRSSRESLLSNRYPGEQRRISGKSAQYDLVMIRPLDLTQEPAVFLNAQGKKVENIEELDRERIEYTFKTNIVAMFTLVQHVLKYMKVCSKHHASSPIPCFQVRSPSCSCVWLLSILDQPGGSVINVGSIQAYDPSPGILDYATTKVASCSQLSFAI